MNAVMYFEAVARHSRVNLAAEELMVSPSAVSQQIKSLEEQMGVLLFRRVKRRLILTEEGERLYASAAEAIKLLRSAQSTVSRRREYRSLVVRVSASFGVRWLGPMISNFVSKEPNIDLHIDATSELTDFEKENVDLEIRYGTSHPEGLHSKALIVDRVLPMAAPKLALKARELGIEEVLASTRLIHTVKAAVQWTDWLSTYGIQGVDGLHGLRFDRSSMSLQAAKDGLGVVLETATLAIRELQSGSLVPFAPDLGTLDFPTYFLICPARHLNRRAVKSFSDWVDAKSIEHEREKTRVLASLGVAEARDYLF